jgi:hypothetical protein
MNVRSLSLCKIYRYENYIIDQSASWFTANTNGRLGINDSIRLWSQLYGCRKRFLLRRILFYRERRITFIGGTISIAIFARDKTISSS